MEGGYRQGVGIRHAEVYDWTLWQMLDLVTATTNTALNPHFSLTPHSLSPYIHHVSSPWEGHGERERNSQRRAVRETDETGNNRRLGCLTFYQIPPLFHSSGRSPDRLGASLPHCLHVCLPASLGCPSCLAWPGLAWVGLLFPDCVFCHFVTAASGFVKAEQEGDENRKQNKLKNSLSTRERRAKRGK